MRFDRSTLRRLLTMLAAVLILKVTASVVLGYRDYWPANFRSDFLQGREAYFYGAYRWAFYAHIVAGPICLVLGLMLVSEAFRRQVPRWHRRLGKAQGLLVLLLLVPSGLWMAPYSQTGAVAGLGFALLAIATGTCVSLGLRAAVQRRFAVHREWMWRCFLLLSSAVVLRIFGGLVTVTGVGSEWGYPLAAWACWIAPLAAFELSEWVKRRSRSGSPLLGPLPEGEEEGSGGSARTHSKPTVDIFSPPAMEISARR